jgi:hypothetical protein
MYSRCVKRVFYSAFVRKCTDMCKHRLGVQLLQNPPLCSSTNNTGARSERARTGPKTRSTVLAHLSVYMIFKIFQYYVQYLSWDSSKQTPVSVRSVSLSLPPHPPPPNTSDLWPQLSILCGLSLPLRGKYWNEAESNYAIELIARGYHLPNYLHSLYFIYSI